MDQKARAFPKQSCDCSQVKRSISLQCLCSDQLKTWAKSNGSDAQLQTVLSDPVLRTWRRFFSKFPSNQIYCYGSASHSQVILWITITAQTHSAQQTPCRNCILVVRRQVVLSGTSSGSIFLLTLSSKKTFETTAILFEFVRSVCTSCNQIAASIAMECQPEFDLQSPS